MNLMELIHRADEAGVRLEIIRGLPVWEASPVYRHQREIDRIRATIKAPLDSQCQCVHISDVVVRFPDGSLKRPDIALYCAEPAEANQDEALTTLPEAVVEIISPGYEAKDLEIAPSFYLAHGIKDVLILDPRSRMVLHHRLDGIERLESPVVRQLECGCSLTV